MLALFVGLMFVLALQALGYSTPRIIQNGWLSKNLHSLWTRAMALTTKPAGSLLAGFFSSLLPCGQLHGFLFAAALTGSALSGAGLLTLLWAASLPGLYLLSRLSNRLPNRRWMAAALFAVGLISVAVFASQIQSNAKAPDSLNCHH
jgi:sulfite exporter TauE/SafE